MSSAESIFTVKSRKGYEARRALIEAAFELIAAGGIAQLTVAAVCESVGRTRSSAYNHFADLNALIDGVLTHTLDRIRELSGDLANTVRPGSSTSEQRLRFVLQLSSKHPKLAKVISELYWRHEPAVDSIEARLMSDVHNDIAQGRIELPERSSRYFVRVAVASAMASLRKRTLAPDKRDSNAMLLRLLFDPIRT